MTLASIAGGPEPPRTVADTVRRWASNPAAGRVVFGLLRRSPFVVPAPRVITSFLGLPGRVRFFTRADDVAEIVGRPDDFTIAEINGERIERASGPFLLSWDRGDDYAREDAFLEAVVEPADLERIGLMVEDLAATQLAARRGETLDAVADFSRPIAVALVQRYLGVGGPDPVTLAHWLRGLFDACFVTDDTRSRSVASRIRPQFRDHLLELIREQRAEGPDDTVLGRMVGLAGRPPWAWVDDDIIRRNIAGLAVGAVDTTSKATALVIDELLRRPDAREAVAAAHASGDHGTVLGHVIECLRFNPHQPMIVRHSRQLTRVGNHRVPAGSTVAVVTMAAAFDASNVPSPSQYRPDRSVTMVRPFGDGMHECFGRRINEVTLPRLVGALARAIDSRAGRMRWDGPFPDRLPVELRSTE